MQNSKIDEILTVGQLERDISQKTLAFYKQKTGKVPKKIISKIFGTVISIVIEDSITPVEKLLIQSDKLDLAVSARGKFFSIVKLDYIHLIETILDVKVCDFFAGTSFESGRIGALLILDGEPQMRPKRE